MAAWSAADQQSFDEEVGKGNVARVEALLDGGTVNIDGDSRWCSHDASYYYFPPLINAIALNKRAMVELLLKRGANPNITNRNGLQTALTVALGQKKNKNQLAYVQLLLDHGADVNYQKSPGAAGYETALHVAVRQDNAEAIKLLLTRGADASIIDHSKCSPRQVAQRFRKTELASLLPAGSPAEELWDICRDSKKLTADGEPYDRAALERFIVENGINVREKVPVGLLPSGGDDASRCEYYLSCACAAGNVVAVEALLAQGANPIQKEGSLRRIALHYAAAAGSVPVINLLIEAGVDVNFASLDGKGSTPIVEAVKHPEAVAALLAHGADVSGKTKGRTLLQSLELRKNKTPATKKTIKIISEHMAKGAASTAAEKGTSKTGSTRREAGGSDFVGFTAGGGGTKTKKGAPTAAAAPPADRAGKAGAKDVKSGKKRPRGEESEDGDSGEETKEPATKRAKKGGGKKKDSDD